MEDGEGSSLRIRFFLNHIEWRQGRGHQGLQRGHDLSQPTNQSTDFVAFAASGLQSTNILLNCIDILDEV